MKSSKAMWPIWAAATVGAAVCILAMFGCVPLWAPMAAFVGVPVVGMGLAISYGALRIALRPRKRSTKGDDDE